MWPAFELLLYLPLRRTLVLQQQLHQLERLR